MTPRGHKKISQKDASPEQYIASSIIRFGRLNNYIQEKLLVDYFAIKGNLTVVEGLKIYIEKNIEQLRNQGKIKILDIGPAIGALTTMLALSALEQYGLVEQASVYLIDVSQNVIEKTQSCDFFYPHSILNPSLKSTICRKLRQSKGVVGSAEELPWKNESFDIVLAGFLFHHLHDSVKPAVAKECMRTLKKNGFLGITEEWFENYAEDYAVNHKDDDIPLAYESIINYKNLSKMFPNLKVFYTHDVDTGANSYSFCGTKR